MCRVCVPKPFYETDGGTEERRKLKYCLQASKQAEMSHCFSQSFLSDGTAFEMFLKCRINFYLNYLPALILTPCCTSLIGSVMFDETLI